MNFIIIKRMNVKSVRLLLNVNYYFIYVIVLMLL